MERRPAAVILTMPGKWVFGALGTQLWSFAGDNEREDISLTTVQPFVNYNFERGWYVSSSPVITANSEADGNDNTFTVPVGGGFGRLIRLGKLPVNLQAQAFYNVVEPDDDPAADWTLRLQVRFLLPNDKTARAEGRTIMRRTVLAALGPAVAALLALPAGAQVSEETLQSISTPDKVETRVGTLEFRDGAPSAETAEKVYDTLDFTRGLNVFNNSFRGASAYAIRKGFLSIGAEDNTVVLFLNLWMRSHCFSQPTPTPSITWLWWI